MPTELKHMEKKNDICLKISFEDTKEGERAVLTFPRGGICTAPLRTGRQATVAPQRPWEEGEQRLLDRTSRECLPAPGGWQSVCCGHRGEG